MPQMDPRALKATSVKAEDEHANSAEPQALKITAASSNPKMFTLPWHKPLATWPEDLLANLPRGISRHVVRFVHVGDEVYAMKEITRQVAEREYEILRRLQKLELPTVTPIAVVIGRHTGDLQAQLTDGQREYDIDLARTNIIGELMDLASGKLLPGDVDEIEVGNRLVDRYHSLWSALTDTDKFNPDEMWKIEQRVNKLNDLGFDVDELEMKTAEDGKRVLVRPRVVDAGYANRKLLRLTGLDVQENQARRLLNDLDAYRASTWREGEDLEIVATDWMREVFEPTVRMIPREYRSQIEPAQFFHEVLDHRWFLAEKAGHDVPMGEAVTSYIDNALPSYSLDSKALAELNEEADSGVIDDESTYSDPDDDGYNPDDDPDAAVWSH